MWARRKDAGTPRRSPDKHAQLSITILAMYYAPEQTGSGPYNAGLAEGLASRGHRVRVITSNPHYPSWRPGKVQWRTTESIAGVEVVRLRHYIPRRPSNLRRVLYEAAFGLRSAFAGWGKPDVLITTSPALVSSGVALARAHLHLWRRPALGLVAQDLYSRGTAETMGSGGLVSRIFAGLERATMRAADGIVVVHDRFKDVLVAHLRIPPASIAVVRNWSHVHVPSSVDRAVVRARMGWGPEIVVLHAGNMGVKQGLENVVEAAKVAHARRDDIRFVLLGDGNQRNRLMVMATGTPTVEFQASLPGDQFVEAMISADVLLVNERAGISESAVPSKLTSYFASGNAVLAAVDPDGVVSSELEASGAGITVDPRDPTALVDAALALGSNDPVRTSLGDNGKKFADTILSQTYALDRYDDWVHDLVVSRHARG